MFFCFFQTMFTKSEKPGIVVRYFPFKVFSSLFQKRIHIFRFQVHDPSALRTHEMAVLVGPSVETVGTAEAGKLLNFANISKERKIAVYGTKADVRVDELHILIYDICSRMIISGHKEFF